MNKKRIILCALALLLILSCILPGLVERVQWEQTSKVYVAAIDVSRLKKFFDDDEMRQILADYQAAGATTALFNEMETEYGSGVLDYDEDLIRMAYDMGYNIALAPSVNKAGIYDLERLVQEYDVKYIKLQTSITRYKSECPKKAEAVCRILEEYDLTLVLTETNSQLGNSEPVNYEDYLEAADGKILRTFNSYTVTNVEYMDYPAVYYQIYNSTYDRNARFITIKQLDDEGFTAEENAERTQKCVRLYCDKMDSHGFVCEGEVNYNDYSTNRTLISAAAAAVGVLMFALAVDLLWKKEIRWLLKAALGGAAAVFAATFVLPESIVLLYPTVFALMAPSFCIAVFAVYIEKLRTKLSFPALLLSSVALGLGLLLTCGGIMTALLSGPDYYLNELTFRGVKLTLVVPMVFVVLLILAVNYKKRTLAEYKSLALDAVHQIRWYHLLLVAVVAVVAVIYVVRSGNVNTIPFVEVYLRNWITEHFAARPRTKEFAVGWPCLVLYVYYAKADKAKILQYVFALGASILFASVVNTFCHVFTLAETMFMRVVNGALFGAVVSIAALAANALILKMIKRYQKKANQ